MSGGGVPDSHRDLLLAPLFGSLGTLRHDGGVQVNPMWFLYQSPGSLAFTTTTTRVKFRNLTADPRFSLCVTDPVRPYRYLEVRGSVTTIESDHDGHFFTILAERYGRTLGGKLPPDVADRVKLVGRIDSVSSQ
ncbi:PPOX class F420-dependent enzyme [Rhodococcus sp. 06-156-3C]|uniref:PPOX class F420-dependent oxidoreductase n=1 Tax=Nocardiaceae TaxID=85025 RepID=UPI0005230103|nr:MULTISPECIES: PPOX class F420-dependent oxidoreductase [Rhodococcus]OZD18161.1 PPOX class F420-dependent enzyme [Rhodococcus sp. 06-156-4C]OZD18758.1 PPOX class F420-dependent enzyme [Rhodococcus sp. 06-156-3C]OZD22268.1 PPOX class F420-dependent enzyme [Rhodococcus sp. 06-156-4a]OZD34074.1 PPOX class F420-dependent enzyme [Rhodococcus sp. 06-156-3b]OZD38811.1 PPOX class F420-dependent enzyme [Rhodococcus sp. 06-156-3]